MRAGAALDWERPKKWPCTLCEARKYHEWLEAGSGKCTTCGVDSRQRWVVNYENDKKRRDLCAPCAYAAGIELPRLKQRQVCGYRSDDDSLDEWRPVPLLDYSGRLVANSDRKLDPHAENAVVESDYGDRTASEPAQLLISTKSDGRPSPFYSPASPVEQQNREWLRARGSFDALTRAVDELRSTAEGRIVFVHLSALVGDSLALPKVIDHLSALVGDSRTSPKLTIDARALAGLLFLERQMPKQIHVPSCVSQVEHIAGKHSLPPVHHVRRWATRAQRPRPWRYATTNFAARTAKTGAPSRD
jgi:hypothetical protein